MFVVLRRIERWLHQHIFKVGWLSTQNYQTTTILYYTFFLPGVVLHELVLWLVSGMVNVRADAIIKWPEEQQIGQLDLKFVQVSKKASNFRRAVIAIAPLIVGIVAIWFIADSIFDITAAVEVMNTGELTDIAAGLGQLTGAPNFWLWVYIVLTIANTMYPSVPKDLQGWRTVLGAGVAVALALTAIGLGGEIFEVLSTPLGNLIYVLQLSAIMVIAIDFVMVLVLGTIEYTIERVTGNSATFTRGKMETMTRAEAIADRERKRTKAREAAKRRRNTAADTGPSTIYAFSFPIAGSPSELTITDPFEIEKPAPLVDEGFGEVIAETPETGSLEALDDRITVSKPRNLEAEAEAPASVPEEPVDEEEKTPEPAPERSIRFNTPATRREATSEPNTVSESASSDDDTDKKSEPAPRRPAFGVNRQPVNTSKTEPDETIDDADEDNDDSSIPVASSTPRKLGVTPFGTSTDTQSDNNTDDADEDDTSEEVSASTPQRPARFGTTPFRESMPTVDDDLTVEKASTGKQSALFDVKRYNPLNRVPDDEETPDDTETESTSAETATPDTYSEIEAAVQETGTRRASTEADTRDSEEVISITDETDSNTDKSDSDDEAIEDTDTTNDDTKSTPAAFTSSRFSASKSLFGVSPFASSSAKDEDESSDESEDDKNNDDKPPVRRFGVASSPFARSKSTPTSTDDDNEDAKTEDTSSTSPTRRSGVTPFPTVASPVSDDDDDEDGEDSIFRRGRVENDAVSDLFSGFSTSREQPTDDDTDDEDDVTSRYSRRGSTSSRFGGGTPIRRSLEVDDDDDSSSRFSFDERRGIGTSRAVPKPSASRDDNDEDEQILDNDDVAYVDVDDEIYYEDDEEFIDYDDD